MQCESSSKFAHCVRALKKPKLLHKTSSFCKDIAFSTTRTSMAPTWRRSSFTDDSARDAARQAAIRRRDIYMAIRCKATLLSVSVHTCSLALFDFQHIWLRSTQRILAWSCVHNSQREPRASTTMSHSYSMRARNRREDYPRQIQLSVEMSSTTMTGWSQGRI
jgi:hypothetical protein